MKTVPADLDTGTKACRQVHCKFQSTGACNLGLVNSISSSSLYIHQKERGRGTEKQRWGIEMNESREV